jgi:hypothetical protein
MEVNTWLAGFIPGQPEFFQDRPLSGSMPMKRMLRAGKKRLHVLQRFE